MQTELKPCPFCGNSETPMVVRDLLPDNDDITFRWRVICSMFNGDGCGAQTSVRISREKAIKAWNRRANDAEREQG